MKESLHVRHYLRYCDDTVMMVATKEEAVKALREYDRLSEAIGLVVKHNAIISRVGNETKHERNRKRKRSKRA